MSEQFVLRMILTDPRGKSWEVAMPIDAFEAYDRYAKLTPPHEWDMRTFEQTVAVLKKREYRKDDFRHMAERLATALGERMEDEEGWHGIHRQGTYQRQRSGV